MILRNFYTLFIVILFISLPDIAETSGNKGMATQAFIEVLSEKLYEFKEQNGRFPSTDEGFVIAMTKYNENIESGDKPHDSWGNEFVYIYPSKYGNKEFDLYSMGQNGIDDYGQSDDITNWKELGSMYFPKRKQLTLWFIVIIVALIVIVSLKMMKNKKKRVQS